MPKQTFLNLPEAKRRAFLEMAVEEFAANDFESASVSRIVARLGIAKGSVYQYFEDKRDLYLYLISFAAEERLKLAQEAIPMMQGGGFLNFMQSLLEVGVRFTIQQPRLNQLIYRAVFGAVPFRDELIQRLKVSSLDMVRGLLAQGIAAGEIDPAVDLDTAAYILNLMTVEFTDLLVSKLGITPQALISGEIGHLDMEAIQRVLKSAVEFIWYGLAKRPDRR